MTDDQLYRENILDHSTSPRHFGTLDDATFSHRELNTNCGDEFTFHVRLDEAGKVADARFDGVGCAVSKAAASMLTEILPGKTLHEILKIPQETVTDMLGIPMTTSRLRCALLGLKAVQVGSETHLDTIDRKDA